MHWRTERTAPSKAEEINPRIAAKRQLVEKVQCAVIFALLPYTGESPLAARKPKNARPASRQDGSERIRYIAGRLNVSPIYVYVSEMSFTCLLQSKTKREKVVHLPARNGDWENGNSSYPKWVDII